MMPNLPSGYNWPYSEGLRMDEAMNPLTLLTSAATARSCPTRTALPSASSSPWKYGFKSAKMIVKFNFTDKEPRTTWNDADGQEYGFYSNVNPTTTMPAGLRPTSAASTPGSSPAPSPPRCSTATATRSQACTPA